MRLAIALAATAALLIGGGALAAETTPEVTGVAYVRLPAPDLAKTARFYEAAFDMHEVMRVEDHEIGLNVGASPSAAQSNLNARVILDRRMVPDERLTLVLHTRNLQAVVARAEGLGGKVLRAPQIRPNGFYVAIIEDVAGNHVELLEER